MIKKGVLPLACTIIAILLSACQRDTFGDLFVKREPVTFHVLSDSGQSLSGVCVKTEELDAFDNDPIIGRTHYNYTDTDGLVTVQAAFDEKPGYSNLSERTTLFTFTASDYVTFDTIFNSWEGTIEIVLNRK